MEMIQKNGRLKGEFTAIKDGKEAGKMTYSWAGVDKVIIDHTQVYSEFAHQGVGLALVQNAVDYARKQNIKIILFVRMRRPSSRNTQTGRTCSFDAVMEDISLQRLANQRFQDISFSNAKQVVEWFGAIQGQEYSLTKWGIGLRAPKLLDDDIERELTKGRILRTHVLRPTWHLVSANDIRWMLKLTAPGVHQVSAYMLRSLSLDKKVFGKANNILEKILEGRSRTRDEINKEFKNNKIIASGPRLAYIFMNAELEGLICSGPRIGKQFSYALLDERCKPTPPLLRDEALTRLAEIYFTSRGPATVHDFATWSGLKISDCKRGIAASNKVKEELIGGRAYHLPKLRRSVDPSPGMLLLPIYDEMIMGYKDRTPMFQYQKKVAPKIDLSFNSMIMWKGQVIGTWRRVDEGVIKTQFRFFKRMDRAQKASFNESFDRLVSFSQRKVEKEIL